MQRYDKKTIRPKKRWKNYTFSLIIVDCQTLSGGIIMHIISEKGTAGIPLGHHALIVEVIGAMA